MHRVKVVLSGSPGGTMLAQHYFQGVPSGTSDAQAAVDRVRDLWLTLDNYMINSISWATAVDVEEVDHTTGDILATFATTSRSGAGGDTGEWLPLLNQVVITWRSSTFVGGRRVQGRTYVPALGESSSPSGATGRVAPATVSGMQTAVTAYQTAVGPFAPCVWSRKHALEPAIATGIVRTYWGVQRRRRLI